MSEQTFETLKQLLTAHHARFRIIEHPKAGKSEEVAAIRGTAVGQGAKALVCVIKGNGVKQHVLAVLPADKQAALQKIAQALGGTRASLASPDEVARLTDCVFGAIPPFSFHEQLRLIADPALLARFDELAFNAGLLERSIVLNVQDYERIAKPEWVDFHHDPATSD